MDNVNLKMIDAYVDTNNLINRINLRRTFSPPGNMEKRRANLFPSSINFM